ncbi:MAG: hypothetical protein ABIP64_12665 [Burkholderiales bacterium]
MRIILMSFFGVLMGMAVVVFMWFRPESRFQRWAKQARGWDYMTANTRFQEARRVVVSQLRHPGGETSQSVADAAFDLTVACTDRMNELNGKLHGTDEQGRLRRNLLRTFQREADYWVAGEYGLENLGRDQEPTLFAAQRGKSAIDLG